MHSSSKPLYAIFGHIFRHIPSWFSAVELTYRFPSREGDVGLAHPLWNSWLNHVCLDSGKSVPVYLWRHAVWCRHRWYRSDATTVAGYVTIMTMIRMMIVMMITTHTHTRCFNGHFSRWTRVSQLPRWFSFSIYSWTVHPFGTGLNFPCQPWYNVTKSCSGVHSV